MNNIKIIIAQRGWVFIGKCRVDKKRHGSAYYVLENAYNIGNFGTENGVGQLALTGPTNESRLMACGKIELHELTTIAVIDCNEEVWASRFNSTEAA